MTMVALHITMTLFINTIIWMPTLWHTVTIIGLFLSHPPLVVFYVAAGLCHEAIFWQRSTREFEDTLLSPWLHQCPVCGYGYTLT